MSRIYDALRKSERENRRSLLATSEPPVQEKASVSTVTPVMELAGASVGADTAARARLVAITDPRGLGAEKFRALAARLEHLRRSRDLKSLQVTSGTKGDGKTLTSGNLALTLARRSSSKVLLIEGDLHKPSLASLFGLDQSLGLSQWWLEPNADITRSIRQLKDRSLWLLSAGGAYDQPSEILRSARFSKAFAELAPRFDWIVVDSTPLLPMVDANLWSRLVDGTLLVVREGATRINALKKGLESLDNPKLVGVVLNEASEFEGVDDYQQYYTARKNGKGAQNGQTTEDVT